MSFVSTLARGGIAAVVVAGLAGCAAISVEGSGSRTSREPAQVKAVYHLTNGLDEAQRAVGNIRNHLNADPKAKIVVVGNGSGIEFMLDGANDRNGNPFDATIQDLKGKGVEFRLCNNTLVTRKIDRSKVIPEVTIVESGVAEAARLQIREGFAYLRP
jgi:hypothetical protein